MAIRLAITPTDVKATKIVKPQWYGTKIVGITEEVAKDKESTNIVVDVIGAEGDANGVPCKCWFSEKFPGGAVAFVRACGGRVTEDEGVDPDFDWERQVGKTLKAKWITFRGKSGEDKARNNIDDWAPMGGSSVSEPVSAASFDA